MPVIKDDALITVGSYYVNVRTGVVVQIMEVDLSGTSRVQNILEPVDSDADTYQQLTEPQITSCLWHRLEPGEAACPTE